MSKQKEADKNTSFSTRNARAPKFITLVQKTCVKSFLDKACLIVCYLLSKFFEKKNFFFEPWIRTPEEFETIINQALQFLEEPQINATFPLQSNFFQLFEHSNEHDIQTLTISQQASASLSYYIFFIFILIDLNLLYFNEVNVAQHESLSFRTHWFRKNACTINFTTLPLQIFLKCVFLKTYHL